MFLDVPRTIYLISPQSWNGFKVSKHHYARALAEMGHRVFFIESEATTPGWGRVEISDSEFANVKTVRYAGKLFRWLRFRARWLYDALAPTKVRQLMRRIGTAPDIVWDFDNQFQFRSLNLFDPALKIFHPVDSLLDGMSAAKNQDLHFALSQEFTRGVDSLQTPTLFVPHGLNPAHASYAKKVATAPQAFRTAGERRVVGYVGNLAMKGIDWSTIERLVSANPDVLFRLIGPYEGLTSLEDRSILERLAATRNCELPGLLKATDILAQSKDIDLWLVCYDTVRRPDAAINAHKILEYLATGKAVLSNYVAAYDGTGLLHMPTSGSNDKMLSILADLLAEPERANSEEEMVRRATFALKHSYGANLSRINQFLTEWAAGGIGDPRALSAHGTTT